MYSIAMALGRQRVRKEALFVIMRRCPLCLCMVIRALSIGGEQTMGFVLRVLPLTFQSEASLRDVCHMLSAISHLLFAI